ncbi:MAG TPA: hypothetical protein VFV73_25020 [Streptosporangiaceae bacterium]|nr:hypothetical protein [Streptosporangiaceae bacterium]
MSGDDLPVREDGQPSSRLSRLDDEGLLAVVRAMLSRSEAAPDWSAELAKGSYDLRAVDAELAVLSSDSLSPDAGLAPGRASTRSGATARMAVFDTADLSVEIEIEPGERAGSWRLIGQLNPAAPARIKIRQQQAESFWVEADRLGRFAAGPLQGGPLSLVCLRSGLPAAVTEWIAVG